MIRTLLAAAGAAAAIVSAIPAQAQQPAPSASQEPRAGRSDRPQLFTPEERNQYREKMKGAKSTEERAQLRAEIRKLAEQRAKEKGVALPGPGDRRARQARGQDRPAVSLLTPDERTQLRDKMRGAQTPEQRAELRKEYRALLEQRAREKGVDLKDRRHQHGPRRGAPERRSQT